MKKWTTKEIILENFEMPKDYKFVNGEDKEVWFGVEELKKDKKIIPVYDINNKLKYYSIEISIKEYNLLCNSSEQDVEINRDRVSVSDEHAGEDKVLEGLTTNSSKSSHVQNPKFKASGNIQPKFPKKCTCDKIHKPFAEVCSRCGGEL